MLAAIVTQSLDAAQTFFLIAIAGFVVLAVIAALARDLAAFVMAVALLSVAAGLLWFAAPTS